MRQVPIHPRRHEGRFYLEPTKAFEQSLIQEARFREVNQCGQIQSRLGRRSNIVHRSAKGNWRDDCLGGFPDGSRACFRNQPEINLGAFTEMHPDFWMAQHCVGSGLFAGSGTFQVALRFAHVLLQGCNRARFRVESDEAQDAAIYEEIGLCGASYTGCKLAIAEVPALVDYSIREYDGQETVEYGC
jgi:hypothetical protein